MELAPIVLLNWAFNEPVIMGKKRLVLSGQANGEQAEGPEVRAFIKVDYIGLPSDMFADGSGRVYQLDGSSERQAEIEQARDSMTKKRGVPHYHHDCLKNEGVFYLEDIEEIEFQMPVAGEDYKGKEEASISLDKFFDFSYLDSFMLDGYSATYNTKNGIATAMRSRIGKVVTNALTVLKENESLMFNNEGYLCHLNSSGERIDSPDNFTQEQCDGIYYCLKHCDFVFVLDDVDGVRQIVGGFTPVDSSNKVYRYGIAETEYLLGGKQIFISGE